MKSVACTIAIAALIAGTAPAISQTFPTRNLTILVPYAPGGPTDAAARIIGEHMAGTFSQHVLIENVTGGSGVIATARVARAAPDGHTLLLHQLALAANVSLFPKAPFDVEKDLSAIGLVNTSPMIIVGRKTLAANSAAELAAWMKEPGRHVKFKGYGVTARQRLASVPDVATLPEQGYESIDLQLWHALFVASGTPGPVIERLNQALRLALADQKVIKSFAVNEATIFPPAQQTPEAASRKVHAEIVRWGDIIRANRIEATQ